MAQKVSKRDLKAEEKRVRSAELELKQWATAFFQLTHDSYKNTQNRVLSFSNIDKQEMKKLLSQFPYKLIKGGHEVLQVLSAAALHVGKIDSKTEQQYGYRLMEPDNIETFFSVLAKVFKQPPEKIRKLAASPPILYRLERKALHLISLPEEVTSKLPRAFFEKTTEFIENLNPLPKKLTKSHPRYSIHSLCAYPSDWTRVKKFKNLVFKRVDLLKVGYATQEIDIANDTQKPLKAIGKKFRPLNFCGFIFDKGNIYLVSEYEKNTQSLYELMEYTVPRPQNLDFSRTYNSIWMQVKKVMLTYTEDLDKRNVLVQYKDANMEQGEETSYILTDFEPYPFD